MSMTAPTKTGKYAEQTPYSFAPDKAIQDHSPFVLQLIYRTILIIPRFVIRKAAARLKNSSQKIWNWVRDRKDTGTGRRG